MTNRILAPMSGKVSSVNIEIGQAVQEDEDAFLIEAM